MATEDLVLITGGSGFLGSHCIIEALRKRYKVRTTIRSLKRAEDVRQMVQNGGISEEQAEPVEFVVADLNDDKGWLEACRGCKYVLHVASPLLTEVPKNPDDVIKPAVEGTLRLLRAAKEAGGVRRVVLTSSMAAVMYGHSNTSSRLFTETDWTNVSSPGIQPYHMSKTLAERAAWDFVSKQDGDLELSVIAPYAIFGPVLNGHYAASMEIIVRLINGQLPGCPKLNFGVVDVRDVAELHLRAMTDPEAKGERFIANGDAAVMSMRDVALKLKRLLGSRASKVPTREMPNFVIQFAGWFDKTLASVVSELGVVRNASNAKARENLGWQPRVVDETLKDAAESVFKYGLAK